MPATQTVKLHLDPTWGYDPWPGAGPRGLHGGDRLFFGADTIGADLALLPPSLDLYGSYVDNFGGFPALARMFAGASSPFLVSFTIFGNRALCADVEPGAMRSSDLPHWLDTTAEKDAEGYSWVYTSASNMSAVNAVVGGRKIKRFSAHYGHGPHICGPTTCGYPQADWTQWDDKGANGQNIDRSIGNYLPATYGDPHYERFFTGPFASQWGDLNERKIVERYDGARKHPAMYSVYLRRVLEPRLSFLAARVADIAINQHPSPDGTPSWGEDWRGWRFQKLIHRAQGARLA